MLSETDFGVFEAFFDEDENLVIRVWKNGLEQLYNLYGRDPNLKELYIFDSGAIEDEKGVDGEYFIRNLNGGIEVTHAPSEASARKRTLENAIETLSNDLKLEYGKYGLFLPRECGVDHPLPCGEDPDCKQDSGRTFEREKSFQELFGSRLSDVDDMLFGDDNTDETELADLVEIQRTIEQKNFGKSVSDCVREWSVDSGGESWSDNITNSAVSIFRYDNPQRIKQVRSWEKIKDSLEKIGTNRRRAVVLVNSVYYVQETLESLGREIGQFYINELKKNPDSVSFDGVSEYLFARQLPRVMSIINLRNHFYETLGDLLRNHKSSVGKIGEEDAHPSQLEITQIIWKALFESEHNYRESRFENLVKPMFETVRTVPDGIIGKTPRFMVYSVDSEVVVSCRDCGGKEQVENLQNHECNPDDIEMANGETVADSVEADFSVNG